MKAAKQTIVSTIFSYLGVALGAFYTIFIIPKLFDQNSENYGALVSLLNYVGIFVIFASFSASYTIVKFYPISDKEERSRLLSFLLKLNIVGIIVGTIIFYFYSKHHPIYVTVEETRQDISFFFYPLLCSFTLFSFLQAYCVTQLEVAIPTFLNNTFTKLWMFSILLLLFFNVITFQLFTYLYFGQFIASFILLVLFVWKKSTDKISLINQIPTNYKAILSYSLFAFFTGSSAILITKVDIQMVERYIGISEVGFYSIGLFFMSVLLIPKNMLMLVSRNIVSRDFQKQDLNKFIPKYKKISFAFLLGTLIIFIGIFININELMEILGNKFGSTSIKYVIIILGFGRILESIFMLNTTIIEYSKYYRWGILFETSALLAVIILNILLVPVLGLTGIALASALVYITVAIAKSIFVYKKFQISPFRKKDGIRVMLLSSLFFLYFIPITIPPNNFITDTYSLLLTIIAKCTIYSILLFIIIEKTNIRKEYWNIDKNHE